MKKTNAVTYGATVKISKLAPGVLLTQQDPPPNTVSVCHVIHISDQITPFFSYVRYFRGKTVNGLPL